MRQTELCFCPHARWSCCLLVAVTIMALADWNSNLMNQRDLSKINIMISRSEVLVFPFLLMMRRRYAVPKASKDSIGSTILKGTKTIKFYIRFGLTRPWEEMDDKSAEPELKGNRSSWTRLRKEKRVLILLLTYSKNRWGSTFAASLD
ncbi:hypothetical protein TWF173_001693 [Orbilia oligospora]|nr:hypothetical protein TWF173_001693 [Orbilia oligospora]